MGKTRTFHFLPLVYDADSSSVHLFGSMNTDEDLHHTQGEGNSAALHNLRIHQYPVVFSRICRAG